MNNDRDIKPDNITQPATTDPRVVYGARCVWWDSIRNTRANHRGLPCCPHCGSVLFEVESELVWWTNVDAHAEHTADPDYRPFIEWLRGRCYPSIELARLEYRLVMLERKFAEPREGGPQ